MQDKVVQAPRDDEQPRWWGVFFRMSPSKQDAKFIEV